MPLLKMAFALSRGAASKDAATCAEAAGSETNAGMFYRGINWRLRTYKS